MILKDKQDVHILTNTHRLPVEGNFNVKDGKAKKLVIVEEQSEHGLHIQMRQSG